MCGIASSFIEQLIYSSNHPAHLKGTNGKYLVSNDANDKLFAAKGVKSLVNHTIWDLNDYMEPLWGRMATDIVAIESNLKATLQVYLRSQYPFLNAHGAVVVQLVKKYPVLNSNNIVCGIYSVGEIVTDEINLFELFKLYLKFYADKSRGIQNFLAHINLFNDFYELPTEREVIILIAKKYYYHPKLIASNLGIETKTVESHIYKIKLKLKSDLNSVVLSMRLRSGELI